MAVNKIPIVVPPEEDEFIYSYICRLAKFNGFTDLSGFIHRYALEDFYRNSKDGGDNILRYTVNRYCRTMYFTNFYKALDTDMNIVDLYLSLSLYSCTSTVMLPHQQVAMINYIFGSKERFFDFIPFVNANEPKLRFCPICKKKQCDTKGYTWFKRAHQLPGVNVCYEHQCSLQQYNNNPRFLFENDFSSDINCCENVTEQHVEYANFLNDLNNSNYQMDYFDLRKMFYNKSVDTKDLDIVSCSDFINTFDFKDVQKRLIIRSLTSGRLARTSESVLMMLIYLMFRTITEFKKYADIIEKPVFEFKDYSVVGAYRKNISLIKHHCGCEFVGTEYGIRIGWGCPECLSKLSPDEMADHLFRSAYPEGYSIIEPYKQGTASMVMLHDLCGQEKKITFFDLLSATACKCLTTNNAYLVSNGTVAIPNTFRTFDSIKDEHNMVLENEGSDFRIVDYSGSTKPAKIHHSKCNKTFNVPHWSRFIRTKKCPYCNGTINNPHSLPLSGRGNETSHGSLIHGPIASKEQFITTMSELVGDDYELVGEYNGSIGSITLLHKKCGHTFTTTASRFCNGLRCKCETFLTDHDTFMNAFRECTDDCYDIEESSLNYFKITEKSTGKTMVLSKAQITQELNKVTPSLILDNEHRHRFEGGSYPKKRVYTKFLYGILLEHVDDNGVFNLNDIMKYCEYSLSQLYKAMTGFKGKGIVEYAGKTKCYRLLNTHLYDE